MILFSAKMKTNQRYQYILKSYLFVVSLYY